MKLKTYFKDSLRCPQKAFEEPGLFRPVSGMTVSAVPALGRLSLSPASALACLSFCGPRHHLPTLTAFLRNGTTVLGRSLPGKIEPGLQQAFPGHARVTGKSPPQRV